MLNELSSKIRQVTDEDRGLPYISYSKLSNFEKCPLSHKLKYVDKNFSNKSTLAMEIGSILHKGLELKGEMIMNGCSEIDYEYLKDIIEHGYTEKTDKSENHILGVSELKKKYFEEFYAPDNKSGMNYEQKMKIFYDEVLPTRMLPGIWTPIATEQKFEFVYDNRVIIHGFIDRIDKDSDGRIRITDYKSSKDVFREADIKTPMQHITYDLACILLYGKPADEHEYDFILIDKIQGANDGVCSKGYLKRGINKLDKILNAMDEMEQASEYPPKPTPLCYWCNFHSDSPNADPKFAGLCEYHSLWTPENKTFATLNPYGQGEYWEKPKAVEVKPKRKLIF